MAKKGNNASKPQKAEAKRNSGSGFCTYCLAFLVVILAVLGYFTGLFDFGIEDYEKFHHERVQNFYGQVFVDYHNYHNGYLTFGLWKNYTSGEKINKYEEAAENLYYELAKRFNLTKDSKLLDVACGMASQDVYLHKMFGCNITAVDLLEKHVSIGQQRLQKAGITENVKLIQASATNLPLGNESFSHVLCAEGGPHMHTREQFFRETWRVLKPGGVFAFSETTVTQKKTGFLVDLALRITAYLWRCSTDNMYDNEEYINKLKSLGFTNIKLLSTNLDVYPDYQRNAWEDREQLYAVRGRIVTWAGAFIDVLLRAFSEYEYIDYVLVTGQKPLKS
jgi:microcystin synthetase protein McyJ